MRIDADCLLKNQLLRWKSFCKKTLKFELDFKEVILDIVKFIEIPYNAILEEGETFYIWDYEKKRYIKS